MERDELYLCADGTAQPLPLEHFVVLRRAPTSARFTSYFYNRLDRGQVRLVSYEVADSSELTEDVAGFQAAIEGLLDATSPVE